MKVIVDEWANEKLQNTTLYIQEEFGNRYARQFYREFKHITSLLSRNPKMGSVEPLLEDTPIEYRSIVVGSLNKIVYWVNDDTIEILDFWDVRKEPAEQAKHVINLDPKS